MFDVHVVHTYRMAGEMRERFRHLEQSLAKLRETLEMTISPKIQEALDRIRQTQDIAKSVVDANKLLADQNGKLSAKVAELQGKLDAGGTISAEDLDAVTEIISDTDMVNAQLKTAIPESTSVEPNAGSGTQAGASSPPADPNMGNPATGANTEPPLAPTPTPEEIAARGDEAASAPKPLAGTGG